MDEVEVSPGLRRRWTLLVLLAVVPLLAAVLFLQLFGPPAQPLSEVELVRLRATAPPSAFLPGTITFAGIATIHFFACIAAIIFARLVLGAAPHRWALTRVALVMATSTAILMLALGLLLGDAIHAYRLSYFNVAALYRGTAVGAWLLGGDGRANVLALAAYLPTVLGVYAVSLTAAAATGQLSLIADRSRYDEENWEGQLCLAHARIKRCTYALSFVLVTSTVSAATFFQLPAKIGFSAPAGTDLLAFLSYARARIVDYGAELTMFWGAIYSLTLFAAVGVPLLLVQKEVREFLEALRPPDRVKPFRTRMSEAGVVSAGGEQLKVLVAFVAPLVSAPVTSFLQAATG